MAILTERGLWATATLDERGRKVSGSLTEQGRAVFGVTAAPSSYYLSMDGVDDYVSIPNSTVFDLTNNFKITITFAPKDLTSTNKYLLSRQNAFNEDVYALIWEYANNKVEFYVFAGLTGTNPRSISGITIPDANKHVVTYEYDGTTFKGYLDTVLQFSTAITFSLGAGTKPLTIGAAAPTTANFAGSIWDVSIYKSSVLAGQWVFNTGSGTTVTDTSGNGNHATLTGGTWVVATTVLVSDSFNRATDATTMGSTDSYNGGTAKTWTVYQAGGGTAAYGISSNQAYIVATGVNVDNQFAGVDAAQKDVTITCTIPVMGTWPMLILRATTFNSYTSLQAKETYIVNEYNGTTWTQKASFGTPANGDVLKVTLSGSSLTFYVNGVQLATATSTFNQTSTIFGINARNSASLFDNFIIEATGSVTFTASGTSSGTSTASASPPTIRKIASGTASGTSQAVVTGLTGLRINASGTASGTSQASATVLLHRVASGIASGIATASATPSFGAILHYSGTGTASGTATATGIPKFRYQTSGIGAGRATASAAPILRRTGTGTANGISWTTFIDPNAATSVHKESRIYGILK